MLDWSSRSPDSGRRRHGRRDRAADDALHLELREAILAATATLLASRQFSDLAVAEILAVASVSRGTFYFYFDSKHEVLVELVRRAVAQGHAAAQPWLSQRADRVEALRSGTTAGARRWETNAPILRAIVENWRTDPRLTALWLTEMQSFTDAAIAQITADAEARARLQGVDIPALANALTWLGERLYYLAATDTPPFDDQRTLIDTLVYVWSKTLYSR